MKYNVAFLAIFYIILHPSPSIAQGQWIFTDKEDPFNGDIQESSSILSPNNDRYTSHCRRKDGSWSFFTSIYVHAPFTKESGHISMRWKVAGGSINPIKGMVFGKSIVIDISEDMSFGAAFNQNDVIHIELIDTNNSRMILTFNPSTPIDNKIAYLERVGRCFAAIRAEKPE